MVSRGFILAGILMAVLASSFTYAAVVGSASITAPAVITNSGAGSLTQINLTVTNGTGNVTITGVQTIGNDTTQSAITAAKYASQYTGSNFGSYNFNYRINSNSDNVSGPSAGAAMTLLAVSALTHQQFRPNFTITGTISQSGSIGEVGGVYDKVEAASKDGFKFVMVPAVSGTNPEDALYALIQASFGIPLVQVSNITQAARFAFNSSANYSAYKTIYNPYINYHTGKLQAATFVCSNSCNTTAFNDLVNQTFNFTNNEIAQLSSVPGFMNISIQLGRVLNQSEAVGALNYKYTAADFAFLDYIDAYYFLNHAATKSQTINTMTNVQGYCDALTPPQLTTSNYEDVISAELRQTWGNYSVSTAIGAYNLTAIDTDGVLTNVYTAGESYAWCHASNIIYTLYSNATGNYVSVSPNLKTIAFNRMGRATAYGTNLYTSSAQLAYKQANYPVAIIDSDYAYAFGVAGSSSAALNTSTLDNMSLQAIKNATYGTWATEYAKETQFYVAESKLAPNSTAAAGYAQQAYSTALLAQQVSNDTMLIHGNLVVGASTQSAELQTNRIISYINSLARITLAILVVVIILLIVTLSLLIGVIMVLHKHVKSTAHSHARPRRRR
ncbi:MAG: hypothetical protein KGH60_02235 [Candidatus Micrarchaeota archaeon]|nr:hypothetical protein [Candidatus Micrarchaeota archaeon]